MLFYQIISPVSGYLNNTKESSISIKYVCRGHLETHAWADSLGFLDKSPSLVVQSSVVSLEPTYMQDNKPGLRMSYLFISVHTPMDIAN